MSRATFYQLCIAASCVSGLLFTGCQPKKNSDAVKTTYIHDYDVEIPHKQDWLDRGGNGTVISQLKNGVVVREQFKNSLLHGETTATFPHSDTIKRVTKFENGVLVTEITNYPSGTPKEKKIFNDSNEIQATFWYEDSSPRAKELYQENLLVSGQYFNHDGDIESTISHGDGTRVVRDGLGQLMARESIVKGELVLTELYHLNGSPKERIPYAKGKVDGIKKIFLAGGEPLRFEEWKGGVLEGNVVVFANGEKVAEIPYKLGKKDGVELRYKPGTAMIVEEIAWSSDRRHGATVAIIDGIPVTEWYFEGKKVSKPQYLEMVSRSFTCER